MSKYKWELVFNDLDGEFYFQKLVNMSLPETMSLEQAAERINQLEEALRTIHIGIDPRNGEWSGIYKDFMLKPFTAQTASTYAKEILEKR